ncbi:hypothetical protein MSAN_01148400 [Mycena sanguinolenta]|uniref:Uncharacterized protein n=1 Tax=Mycena sanguinolenta TaxID=230812 RepID=A0A8H7D6Z5_9AGAR|nr:hypothetical protein MSAN_01148400 [Mycena sanguinolenta]
MALKRRHESICCVQIVTLNLLSLSCNTRAEMGYNPLIPRKRSTIVLLTLGLLVWLATDVWLYPRDPALKVVILRAPGAPDEVDSGTEGCQFDGIYAYVACLWAHRSDSAPAFLVALLSLAFVLLARYLRSRYMAARAPVEVLFEMDHIESEVAGG